MTKSYRQLQDELCEPNTVYIGRPSPYGNPFPVEKYGREQCLALYEGWLVERLHEEPKFLDELKGKKLVCWCSENEQCHKDIIAKYLAPNQELKVLICGDRNWNNWNPITSILKQLPSNTTIIEGDCRGADKMSGYIASKIGLKVIPVPAKWEQGNKAGIERNIEMLNMKPDIVIGFHNNIQQSKGTAFTLNEAKTRGILTYLITETNFSKTIISIPKRASEPSLCSFGSFGS